MTRRTIGAAVEFSARRQPRTDRSRSLRRGYEHVIQPAVTSPIQNAILQVLRARGGKLWMVDLVFELRWRGVKADLVRSEIGELVSAGLVRGPLSAMLAYELTAGGWDAGHGR